MSIRVTVELPESTLAVLHETPDGLGRHVLEAAVAKWYEMAVLSQSKAAEALSVSRSEFLDVLRRYGVSPIQVSPDEYETEFRP